MGIYETVVPVKGYSPDTKPPDIFTGWEDLSTNHVNSPAMGTDKKKTSMVKNFLGFDAAKMISWSPTKSKKAFASAKELNRTEVEQSPNASQKSLNLSTSDKALPPNRTGGNDTSMDNSLRRSASFFSQKAHSDESVSISRSVSEFDFAANQSEESEESLSAHTATLEERSQSPSVLSTRSVSDNSIDSGLEEASGISPIVGRSLTSPSTQQVPPLPLNIPSLSPNSSPTLSQRNSHEKNHLRESLSSLQGSPRKPMIKKYISQSTGKLDSLTLPKPPKIRFPYPPPESPPPSPPVKRKLESQMTDEIYEVERAIWMITDINKEFEFSPTYPNYLCIPSCLSFEQLRSSFSFRSKGRIPVLTWKKKGEDAVLLRSSQPLIGMVSNHSEGDEMFLKFVLALNKSAKRLKIIDARGKNAASANHARGAGYEGSRYADCCSIEFMGIENIHAMRDSLNKIFEALKKPDDGYWTYYIDNTNWLKHIRLIMLAASIVVDVRKFLLPLPFCFCQFSLFLIYFINLFINLLSIYCNIFFFKTLYVMLNEYCSTYKRENQCLCIAVMAGTVLLKYVVWQSYVWILITEQ